jgi:hypothetical protein
VLDIFKDVLLQTLPDDHPAVPEIKKKLRVVVREEEEHVAWGVALFLRSQVSTSRSTLEKTYLTELGFVG